MSTMLGRAVTTRTHKVRWESTCRTELLSGELLLWGPRSSPLVFCPNEILVANYTFENKEIHDLRFTKYVPAFMSS